MTDSKIQKEINLLSFSNKKDIDKEKKILTEFIGVLVHPVVQHTVIAQLISL